MLFDGRGILSSPIPSLPPYSLHPPAPIAISLWNIYTSNVEGVLGLKLLHIPTDEVKVYSVIDEPSSSPLCDLALCYAVYFASLLSLDGSEARAVLGRDKASQLLDLKIGLEQSFSQADFLNKPNIVGLQALAIYLVSTISHILRYSSANQYPVRSESAQSRQRALDPQRSRYPYSAITWASPQWGATWSVSVSL